MNQKHYCIWRKGSTGKNMELELPQRCKDKGCTGFFDLNIKEETILKFCPYFLEEPSNSCCE